MKKTISLGIIAVFLFSLVPFAFADNDSSDAIIQTTAAEATSANTVTQGASTSNSGTNTETKTETKTEIRARAENAKADAREKAKELKEEAKANREEIKGAREAFREKFKTLREEQKAKIEALNEERIGKLSNLGNERLQKIAELDKMQIERLSKLEVKNLGKISELKKDRLERLTNLNQDKIERLSELEQDNLEKVSDLNETYINKMSTLGRARMKELAKLDMEKIKEELKSIKIRKVRSEEDLEERNIPDEKLAEINDKFEKSKEKFKEAKDELEIAKEKLKEAREKKDEKATLEQAKSYVLKVADALTSHLEKLKAKVQESKNIPEDQANKIASEIDVQIAEIAKIKLDAQAATTKEQVKDDAKKLRQIWSKLEHTIKLNTERIVAARVEGLVNRGLVLEKRLDKILQAIKDKGIQVDVSAEVSAFSAKIADSKGKYEQAQAKITEVFDLRASGEPADSDKIKALMKDADDLLKQARDSVKDAHQILGTIVKKIKEAAPDANLSEETEVEIAEEGTSNTAAANATSSTAAGNSTATA